MSSCHVSFLFFFFTFSLISSISINHIKKLNSKTDHFITPILHPASLSDLSSSSSTSSQLDGEEEPFFRTLNYNPPIDRDDSTLLQRNNYNEYVRIFLIPHTHDDVGWIKTANEYYETEVRSIITTIIQSLLKNSKRKFTYVEMAFFSRWWNEQDKILQEQVKNLIKTKQLEFNLGGWAMNDEGCNMYDSEIKQMTEGHLYLQETFGDHALPTVGWHIDPFGHSAGTASLWADIGFDGFGINRIGDSLKNWLKDEKKLQFIWQPSDSFDDTKHQIWTHVMDSHYCTPEGVFLDYSDDINFLANELLSHARSYLPWFKHNIILIPYGCDFTFKDAEKDFLLADKMIDYINNNKTLNAEIRYGTFAEYVKAVNDLNLTWDIYRQDFFPYESGSNKYWTGYFTSRTTLKGVIRSNANLLRSSEILSVLTKQNNFLQDRELIHKHNTVINNLRLQLSESTHHDIITGTSKSFVVAEHLNNFEELNKKISVSNTDIMNSYVKKDTTQPILSTLSTTTLLTGEASDLNTLLQKLKPSETIPIMLFNSLGWKRHEYYPLKVYQNNLVITNRDGQIIPYQIDPIPVPPNTKSLLTNSSSATTTNTEEIYFGIDPPVPLFSPGYEDNVPSYKPVILEFPTDAKPEYICHFLVDIPPLGYETYFISLSPNLPNNPKSEQKVSFSFLQSDTQQLGEISSDHFITNNYYTIEINNDGSLQKIQTSKDNNNAIEMDLKFNFLQYEGATIGQTSGAYIFRPDGDVAPIDNTPVQFKIIKGPYVQTLYQYWSKYSATQIIRLFTNTKSTSAPLNKEESESETNDKLIENYVSHFIEITNQLGPVDPGYEVVADWNTDVKNNDIFYGDSNGLEKQKRMYNHGKQTEEKIASNYYPMIQTAFLQDTDKQWTLISDRSHGVASLAHGNLQVMLLRRCLIDDALGMNEPLDDQDMISLRFLGIFDNLDKSTHLKHRLRVVSGSPLLPFFGKSSSTTEWLSKYQGSHTALPTPLPSQMHLLSLEIRNSHTQTTEQIKSRFRSKKDTPPSDPQNNFILLRLQHLYERAEKNLPVNFNLNEFISQLNLKTDLITETGLTATKPKSTLNTRLIWQSSQKEIIPFQSSIPYSKPTNQDSPHFTTTDVDSDHKHIIELHPREIRSFRLQ